MQHGVRRADTGLPLFQTKYSRTMGDGNEPVANVAVDPAGLVSDLACRAVTSRWIDSVRIMAHCLRVTS
ncbi:hypothetical protein MPNT_50054 [Candidatus Methylacidithermus pantelleriae]|uniref:Uncharacterized protein n=1 Tax=Candidatus Methylacidithermus pantelleriae TaxID=2744239 RepID=A0A8J2FX09_9BACT|nr:hypothetical protein MPNT_50054 [Candidatus Methylacidithermus pantelleriae]